MRCGEGADSDSEQRPGAPTLTLLTTSPVPWRQCHPARAAKRPPPPGRCLPPPLPCPGVASSSWGATACLSPASSSPGSAEGWSHRLQLEDRPHCAVRRGAGENNNQTGKQSRPQRSKPPGAVLPAQGRVLEPSCQRCAMGKASPASPREVELAVVRFLGGRERPGGGYLL